MRKKKKMYGRRLVPIKVRRNKENRTRLTRIFSVTSSNGACPTGTTNYTRGPTQRKG